MTDPVSWFLAGCIFASFVWATGLMCIGAFQRRRETGRPAFPHEHVEEDSL